MITALFVFAVLSLVVGKKGKKPKQEPAEAKCVRRHSHGNEYWGRFEVRPSAATSYEGWSLKVKFNMPVDLEVWKATDTDTANNKYKQEFVLENRYESNAELPKGELYKFDFTARVQGNQARSLKCTEVSFEPLGDGSGSDM